MNEVNETGTPRCASCGIAENDEVKLKNCNGCYLVKYCGINCQKAHRKQHKRECKKRAAELRDELLFKRPESSHLGDCPICCLPLPLDLTKSAMMGCCSKIVCEGCALANAEREHELGLDQKCPFCRKPSFITYEEYYKRLMKRVQMNDPDAIYQKGVKEYDKGDSRSAFEYFTKAAELGNIGAHFRLGNMFVFGLGVEKDEKKIIHHLETAAIGGHPAARCSLGIEEWNRGNIERAVKHWIISATQGDNDAIKELMDAFKDGVVEKEVLAATLRAHKAAVDATKSPQREEAEKDDRIRTWSELSKRFQN